MTEKKPVVCRTCKKEIVIPKGWSAGPAIRRHYWREHRDVMQPERKTS